MEIDTQLLAAAIDVLRARVSMADDARVLTRCGRYCMCYRDVKLVAKNCNNVECDCMCVDDYVTSIPTREIYELLETYTRIYVALSHTNTSTSTHTNTRHGMVDHIN